jgi:dephospho-CoA kinase
MSPPARQVLRLGLTGGIGSGKSTVAARLSQRGAGLIDADAIARSVTATGGIAIPAILQAFGPGMIGADGAMDRDRMRQLAFQDPDAKRLLEHIVHPLVGQETERRAEQLIQATRTDQDGSAFLCLVFDIPLLVESGHWRARLDRVLVVDCLPETQISRVMARNALTRATVTSILANQASREHRLAAADIVVFNDGVSIEALHREVDQLAQGFGL